jgi:hypothetical protein
MIPVVSTFDYLIGIDDQNQPWLLFNSYYEEQMESVCIKLPSNAWEAYLQNGDSDFMQWRHRINQDYQVGRFSRDNPRILTDYQLATPEIMQELIDSAGQQISLIEQEALRLLSQCNTTHSTFASLCIIDFLKQGKNIPIEVFCLAFNFYESDKPLLNNRGRKLLDADHRQAALNKLAQSPVAGCPDAANLVLGMLTRIDDPFQAFHHLNRLQVLKDEFNFRYVRDKLDYYLAQYQYLNQKEEENLAARENLVAEYRKQFPEYLFPNINNQQHLPNFLFMEEALAWEWDCKKCLEKCFLNNQISVNYQEVGDLLHLPSGADERRHDYSIGQAIKYSFEDPTHFTKETVEKPQYPAAGYEDFIIAVWKHYFRFFKPTTPVSTDGLRKVLQDFTQEWNGN